ncbi:ribonuclease III [Violaceomyces palustris]|uniref:Ribonuclease III n=1 Tax=Violaceomyces palustris TaxID=1673888 RepID=A0ACD0P208_9BASI|nr:ribonuclease III [Violaceomyces palustris]
MESGSGLDDVRLSHLTTNPHLKARMTEVLIKETRPPDVVEINPEVCTPKVIKLIEILKCFGVAKESRDRFCGIIFVTRRQTASSLSELLRRLPDLSFIRSEWIVGHDTSNGPAMDWQDQVAVLDRFRRRDPTNLLISTSVTEEGLDVQSANLVIRFDLFSGHIGFLQSKGRARSQDSRFIMMAERGNMDHYKIIRSAVSADTERTKWLYRLSDKGKEYQRPIKELEEDEDELEEEEIDPSIYLQEESTGARLYPHDSQGLVSHYVAYLRTDNYPEPSADYSIETVEYLPSMTLFMCQLRLPSNSPVREVKSTFYKRKKNAKRMAAFMACQLLRQADCLDEHLMPRVPDRPRKRKKWSHGPGDGNQERRAPMRILHMPSKDQEGWRSMRSGFGKGGSRSDDSDPTGDLFVTVLDLPLLDREECAHRPMLILTRSPIPRSRLLELFLPHHEGPFNFGEVESCAMASLSRSESELAHGFTLRLLSWSVRKDFTTSSGQLPFLLLPFKRGADASSGARSRGGWGLRDAVDWQEAERVHQGVATKFDLEDWTGLEDKMVMDSRDLNLSACYSLVKVRHDLTPYSLPEVGSRAHEHGSYWTFFKETRFSRRCEPPPDPVIQPMIQVKRLPKSMNYLVDSSRRISSQDGKEILMIPSFALIHPISTSTARSAMLLPSILTRFDQILLAWECNATFFEGRLNNDGLLRALTSRSMRTSFDYERLEFLGDTFLKLVASCFTFSTRLEENEGQLHLANKEIIVNAKLFDQAMGLELWKFGLFGTGDSSIRKWSPPLEEVTFLAPKSGPAGVEGDVLMEDGDGVDLPPVHPESDEEEDEQEGVEEDAKHGSEGDMSSNRQDEEREAAEFERESQDGGAEEKEGAEGGNEEDGEEEEGEEEGGEEEGKSDPNVYVGDLSPGSAHPKDVIGEKQLADLVESIMGASLETSDLDQTIKVSQILGVLPKTINRMKDFELHYSKLQKMAVEENWAERVDTKALHFLESQFQYTFRFPHLALEAFTHASLLASILPSYQRLEFLGDSFLDFYVVSYLYKAYPTKHQGELTALKDNMVANATLAAISEVLGLSKFIGSNSSNLVGDIDEYNRQVSELRAIQEAETRGWEGAERSEGEDRGARAEQEEEGGGGGGKERSKSVEPYQYWWSLKAPKACADVVESSLGSIVVDSGFDLVKGQAVFDRFFLPFYTRFCTPERAVIPNTKLLSRLLTDMVDCKGWELELSHVEPPSQVGGRYRPVGERTASSGVRCRFLFHGMVLGEAASKLRSKVQRDTIAKSVEKMKEINSARLPLSQIFAIIKAMRWARPFSSFPDFGIPKSRPPPKLEYLRRCDCSTGKVGRRNPKGRGGEGEGKEGGEAEVDSNADLRDFYIDFKKWHGFEENVVQARG